jgi:hypothetical protein
LPAKHVGIIGAGGAGAREGGPGFATPSPVVIGFTETIIVLIVAAEMFGPAVGGSRNLGDEVLGLRDDLRCRNAGGDADNNGL